MSRCVMAALLVGLVGGDAVAADEATVVEVTVPVGSHADLDVGALGGMVNLDPEVVRLETLDGQATLEGLRYGRATLRGWGPEGGLVVRVTVVGPERHDDRPTALREGEPGHAITSATRLFLRSGGAGDRDVAVLAQQVEATWTGARGSGVAEVWAEARESLVRVPHLRLALSTAPVPGQAYLSGEVGSVALDWGPYTFDRDRVAGAVVQLAEGGEAPTWTLAVAGGRQIADAVMLGSARAFRSASQEAVAGLRGTWQISEGLDSRLELALASPAAGTLRSVVGAGITLATSDLDAEVDLGFDGAAGAATGRLHGRILGAEVVAAATTRQEGFTTPRHPAGWRRSRGLSLGATRPFGDTFRLSAAGSVQEVGVDAPTVSARQRVAASARLDDHLRLEAALQASAHRRADRRWRGLQPDLSLVATRLALPRGAVLGMDVTAGHRQVRTTGGVDAFVAWERLRLAPSLTFGRTLSVRGAVERRVTLPSSTVPAPPWTGEARVRATIRGQGPIAMGRVDVGWRRWDHLSFGSGAFSEAGYLHARIQATTRTWHGFGLDLVGTVEHPLGGGRPVVTTELALRQGGARRTTASRGRGAIRGTVFSDEDGDGLRAPEEPGMAGIRVRVDDAHEAVTDASGAFRIRGVRGREVLVRLVDGEDGDTMATTPRVQAVAGRGQRVSFGLGPRPAVVEVLAFNDLDEDGLPGADEPLLRGVALHVGGTTVPSAATGPARAEVPPGPIEGAWTVSLPRGYLASPLPVAFTAAPGEVVRLAVPLHARRSIEGTVLAGPEAVPGVLVQAGARRSVTDADGRFLLRALPPGPARLEIVGGLPEGWDAPPSTEVELGAAPDRLDGALLHLVRP